MPRRFAPRNDKRGRIAAAPVGPRNDRPEACAPAGAGERIATASEQRHQVNCSPDRGSSSTCAPAGAMEASNRAQRGAWRVPVDIVLPFPIEGQAFTGGPSAHWLRNDRFAAAADSLSLRRRISVRRCRWQKKADWNFRSRTVCTNDSEEQTVVAARRADDCGNPSLYRWVKFNLTNLDYML